LQTQGSQGQGQLTSFGLVGSIGHLPTAMDTGAFDFGGSSTAAVSPTGKSVFQQGLQGQQLQQQLPQQIVVTPAFGSGGSSRGSGSSQSVASPPRAAPLGSQSPFSPSSGEFDSFGSGGRQVSSPGGTDSSTAYSSSSPASPQMAPAPIGSIGSMGQQGQGQHAFGGLGLSADSSLASSPVSMDLRDDNQDGSAPVSPFSLQQEPDDFTEVRPPRMKYPRLAGPSSPYQKGASAGSGFSGSSAPAAAGFSASAGASAATSAAGTSAALVERKQSVPQSSQQQQQQQQQVVPAMGRLGTLVVQMMQSARKTEVSH
jgi:hypothetical protein